MSTRTRPFICLFVSLSVRLVGRSFLKINTGSIHVVLSAMLYSDMYKLTTIPTLYETQKIIIKFSFGATYETWVHVREDRRTQH
jgi:hypothetical protein